MCVLCRITKPLTFADCVGDELPLGWEVVLDQQVGVYYIDHINSKSSPLSRRCRARGVSCNACPAAESAETMKTMLTGAVFDLNCWTDNYRQIPEITLNPAIVFHNYF